MMKKPTIRLKANECSVWPGNARDYDALTEERLKTLINSIIAEGRNRVPAVVRRTPDAEKPYEVVVGTRRHWAVAWANQNSYPDIDFVATIEDLDDEGAFRLADIENREREDISDLERGRNYRDAINRYYGGVQARMAERLKITNAMLSRYIALTELPPVIISAFASPADVAVTHGIKLMPLLKDPAAKQRLEAAAADLSVRQSLLQSEGQASIPSAEVVSKLIAASIEKRGRREKPEILSGDRPIGKIIKDHKRDGLTITILPTAGSDVDTILEALRPTIEAAKFRASNRH